MKVILLYGTLCTQPDMSFRLHVHRNAGTCVEVTKGKLRFLELWLNHSRLARSTVFSILLSALASLSSAHSLRIFVLLSDRL